MTRNRATKKNGVGTGGSSRTLLATVVIAGVIALAALYFAFVPPGTVTGADPKNAEAVAQGEKVYRANCASCHGVRLEGQPGWRTERDADGALKPPPHDETGHTWHHPDKMLFAYTKKGGQAFAPPGFKSAMPEFGGALSDREIWAVLAFIKSRWPADIRERQRRIDERGR